MQHRKLRLPLGAIVAVLLIVGVIVAQILSEESGWTWYRVIRVVDGDTIVVKPIDWDCTPTETYDCTYGDDEKIRLIGVDTPETVDPRKPVQHFGKEASEFTRRLVEGKRVRLKGEYTPTCTPLRYGMKDHYGRTLAYVYLDDRNFLDRWGTLLNGKIIREGYGFAYTKYPFCLKDDFVRLEQEAREAGRGLWKEQR